MAIVLVVIGGGLIVAGVWLVFRGDRGEGGEAKFKWKDFEIASAKPSLFLVGIGVMLVIISAVTDRSAPAEPSMPTVTTPTAYGASCCFQGGRCPMLAPGMIGAPCFCMDMAGNSVAGVACQ